MYAITSEDENSVAVAAELGARLTHFNEAWVGSLLLRRAENLAIEN
jgi:hypothetical protein